MYHLYIMYLGIIFKTQRNNGLANDKDGHRERKKKPEVKILGDYCWRKYNIFHQKKSWIQDKTLRHPSLKWARNVQGYPRNQLILRKILKIYTKI